MSDRKCYLCGETKPLEEIYSQMSDSKKKDYIAKRSARNKTESAKLVKREYEMSHRGRFTRYKADAKRYNRVFELDFELFENIISNKCYYCGEDGYGIDRIDSDKGYSVDNCVSCCTLCNSIKSNHNIDIWIEQIHKISNNMRNKNENT